MIKNNFYPDQTPITGDLIPTATVRNISGLTDKDADPSAAYQMGYIPPNNAKWISPRKTTISAEGVKSEIDSIGGYWGFGVFNFYASRYNHPVYFDRNANVWAGTSRYSSDMNFFNSMRAYALKYVDQSFTLQLYKVSTTEYTIAPTTEKILKIDSEGYYGQISFTILSFIDFVENDTAKTVGEYTVHYSDFIDGTHMDIGNGQFLVVRATSFLPLSYYDTYTQNLNIVPFISTRVPRTGADGNDIVIGSPNTFMNDTSTYCRFAVPYNFVFSNDTSTLFVDYLDGHRYNGYNHCVYEDGVQAPTGTSILTSLDFELSQVRMNYIARNEGQTFIIPEQFNSMWTSMRGYYHDNIWTIGFRNDTAWQIGSLEKLYFFSKFYHRVGNSTTPGSEYKTGDYVGIYNNNNPTGLRAFTTYREIEPELMIWQKYGYNIYDDEYDPDAPPTPGGDDTPGDEPQDLPHDDGTPPDLQKDRTIGVPALFITQYALTSSELETVGANLWQSWLTPNTDVHLNFFLPYAQDFGTLNIASAMDFIISLKVFPFEFPLDWLLPANNGVRMGTGHTDFLGQGASYLKSQVYCLDVGSCKVDLPNPYNDFRDMYNCSALCFMPYCGSVELNLQEILGRTLKASYFIDVQSGGCTCVIECEGDAGDYVIASKTGQIGFTLPMTATNAGQLAAQTMSDAVKFAGTVSGTVFDIIGKAKDVAINIAGVNQAAQNGMDFDYAQSKADYYNAKGDIGMYQSGVKGALGVANQAIDMLSRSAVEMPMLSGGGSAESFLFADCVSIQIRRGKYKKPDNYPHSVGYYNLSSHPISYFKGAFTGNPATGSDTGKGLCAFVGIDTSGLDCRDDERAEIISLLESGVYL